MAEKSEFNEQVQDALKEIWESIDSVRESLRHLSERVGALEKGGDASGETVEEMFPTIPG